LSQIKYADIAKANGLKKSGERIFCPRGSAQPIEKAQFRKGNPRKSKPFFFDFLCSPLAGLWRHFEEFGFGLETRYDTYLVW